MIQNMEREDTLQSKIVCSEFHKANNTYPQSDHFDGPAPKIISKQLMVLQMVSVIPKIFLYRGLLQKSFYSDKLLLILADRHLLGSIQVFR
jgi:hypothetical protein